MTTLRFIGDWSLYLGVPVALLLGTGAWFLYRRESRRQQGIYRWLLPAGAGSAAQAGADRDKGEQWIVVAAPALRDAVAPLARQRAAQGMKVVTLEVADVPGVKAENLNIDLRDDILTLSGEVDAAEGEHEIEVSREYQTGKYFRQFSLPEVIDQSKIEADLTDGVLRLTLPKVEPAVPRKITVKAD